MQALALGHSAFMVHSGRQFGGLPMYVAIQEQDGTFPVSRQMELGPHGDGTHGFLYGSNSALATGAEKCKVS